MLSFFQNKGVDVLEPTWNDINPRLYLNHLMPQYAPHGQDYCHSMIGVNTPRSDGPAKASGTMTYASDVIIPGMMYGVCLRSPYPHAEIVSMDTSEAEAMGAVCLTYDDIDPVIVYNERSVSTPSGTYRDRTILRSRTSTSSCRQSMSRKRHSKMMPRSCMITFISILKRSK